MRLPLPRRLGQFSDVAGNAPGLATQNRVLGRRAGERLWRPSPPPVTTHRSVRAFHKRRLIATALMPLVQGDRAVRLLLTQTFEPLKASDRELLINTGRIEVSVPCAGYFAALCRRQGGRAVTLHRRHRMVRQMLHEYATAISTAGHANRSRRLIKCAKKSGHFRTVAVGSWCVSLPSSKAASGPIALSLKGPEGVPEAQGKACHCEAGSAFSQRPFHQRPDGAQG